MVKSVYCRLGLQLVVGETPVQWCEAGRNHGHGTVMLRDFFSWHRNWILG